MKFLIGLLLIFFCCSLSNITSDSNQHPQEDYVFVNVENTTESMVAFLYSDSLLITAIYPKELHFLSVICGSYLQARMIDTDTIVRDTIAHFGLYWRLQ